MKEVIKTTRWDLRSNAEITTPDTFKLHVVTVFEVWSGLNLLKSFKRRKSARKFAAK